MTNPSKLSNLLVLCANPNSNSYSIRERLGRKIEQNQGSSLSKILRPEEEAYLAYHNNLINLLANCAVGNINICVDHQNCTKSCQ